jgi:acetyl esterase/lipase
VPGSAIIARVLVASIALGSVLRAQETANGVTVQENVPYTAGLTLDVYEPADHATKPRPAVVLIHGGGWTSLDKSTMRGMGNFLARSGYVAFSVDYRLFQGGTTNRWPAQLDDVQRAVRWVRANAAKYGIDSNKVGAYGHSAGGQLAALLGMEDTRDNSDRALATYSSKVQAVVDVSGPSDLRTDRDSGNTVFLTSFIGRPATWRDASPVAHASKTNAPFLIVHGTQDPGVPIAQAEELADSLKAAGATVSLVKIVAGHTFQDPAARRQLAIETLAFFDKYLAAQ